MCLAHNGNNTMTTHVLVSGDMRVVLHRDPSSKVMNGMSLCQRDMFVEFTIRTDPFRQARFLFWATNRKYRYGPIRYPTCGHSEPATKDGWRSQDIRFVIGQCA